MSNFCHFELDFQKVDQYTGCKCFLHGTKRHKDTVAKLGTPLYNILVVSVNMT